MYSIGTYVSYRAEGVCLVSEIKMQKFDVKEPPREFYVLSPIRDANSKIYVPIDNEALVSRMHTLCSADEINALADRLRGQKMDWINESRPRNNAFRTIVAEGSREQLILLINTIIAMEPILTAMGRHVTQGDELMLKKALKMLVDEFSFTSDIRSEEELLSVLLGKTKCKNAAKNYT